MTEQSNAETLWCILKRPLLAEEWTVCLRFSTCVEAAHALSHSRPEVGYEYAIVSRPAHDAYVIDTSAQRVEKTAENIHD